MWEEDWALLGIEPTTAIGAIKKAYALKLKATRPDDDAEAYQALRGAYERAQQWARRQSDEPAQAPPAGTAVQPDDNSPAPATAAEISAPPEPLVQPRQLIERLAWAWGEGGEAALMAAWPAARLEIDQQPLSRQPEFSSAFAEWALSLPALPDDFVKALDAHFNWLTDFRTERLLGTPLTHALHEALGTRLRPPQVDAEVLALAEPLRRFAALRASSASWWQMQWLLFLLQPLLARRQGMLGAQWLQRLGVDAQAQRWLSTKVKQGLWLRIAAVSALCAGASWAWHGSVDRMAGITWTWFVFSLLIMRVAQVIGAVLASGHDKPLGRWRRQPMQPWLAIVWLLFAAWMAYLNATPLNGPLTQSLSLLPDWALQLVWVGFAIAGLALAWPTDPLHGYVVAGLAPLVGYFFVALLGDWLPLPTVLLAGMAWMLLAAAVQEQRLAVPGPVTWLLRPMLNSLLLADRWTYAMAMLPAAGSLALGMIGDKNVPPVRLFLTWVLGILLVAWLQGRADALGLKQLSAIDEKSA